MGNSNSNTKRSDDYTSHTIKKKPKEFVDQQINYGSLVTHGIYTSPPEYDIEVVRSFILKKKLSPFYKGMEDYSDNPFPGATSSSSAANTATLLDETSTSTIGSVENNDDDASLHSTKKKLSRRNTASSIDSHRRSRHDSFSSMRMRKNSFHKSDNIDNNFASTSSPTFPVSSHNSLKVEPEHPLYSKEEFFKFPIECPICFLYYPRNINYTRCCDQPICTECFIQIKRTFANPEPTCCPYCVQPNFGVTYLSPDSEEYQQQYDILVKAKEQHDPNFEKLLSQGSTPGKKRRNSISHTDPHIVSSDDIYPGWMLKYEQYQREQQRLEAIRVRNFNVQVNNNAAVALLDAFLNVPLENTNSNRRRGRTLQNLGNDLEEIMLLEAIRRSLADSNNQTEEDGSNLTTIEEGNNVIAVQNNNDSTSNPQESPENIINLSTPEDPPDLSTTIENTSTTTTTNQPQPTTSSEPPSQPLTSSSSTNPSPSPSPEVKAEAPIEVAEDEKLNHQANTTIDLTDQTDQTVHEGLPDAILPTTTPATTTTTPSNPS